MRFAPVFGGELGAALQTWDDGTRRGGGFGALELGVVGALPLGSAAALELGALGAARRARGIGQHGGPLWSLGLALELSLLLCI